MFRWRGRIARGAIPNPLLGVAENMVAWRR